LDGKKKWSLSVKESEFGPFLSHPISDGRVIYFVHPKGRVVAFDKQQQRIVWSSKQEAEYLSDAFLFKKHIFILGRFTTEKAGESGGSKKVVKILKIDRLTGKVKTRVKLTRRKGLCRSQLLSRKSNFILFSRGEDVCSSTSRNESEMAKGPF
jgi:outer membrane protein assembly factor BamB